MNIDTDYTFERSPPWALNSIDVISHSGSIKKMISMV